MIAFFGGRIRENDFLKKYGHLRPGTYDITVPRYDEMDLSVFKNGSAKSVEKPDAFSLTKSEEVHCLKVLRDVDICEISPSVLMTYCGEAIKAREYSKFVSRFVSTALAQIQTFGVTSGLSKEDLSFRNRFHTWAHVVRLVLRKRDRRSIGKQCMK